MSNEGKLLSVCIPTYNRAAYLKKCLSALTSQITTKNSHLIEVIISNNNSTDDTTTVVKEFQNVGYELEYNINEKNLGPDGNLMYCFTKAKGKYVWVCCDDDLLLEDKLDVIIKLLQTGEYGSIYLNNYWFNTDHLLEKPGENDPLPAPVIYDNLQDYLKRVNYWFTFASSNIFNKDLLLKSFEPDKYSATNLIQVNWYATAAMRAAKNVYIEEMMVACKGDNTIGGYNLYKVFGENLINILQDVSKANNVNTGFIKTIKNKLLINFFPGFIINEQKEKTLNTGNAFKMLYKSYKTYAHFWLLILPVSILPGKVSKIYLAVYNSGLKYLK